MYISCSGATRLVVVADVGRRTPFRPALLRAVRCLRGVAWRRRATRWSAVGRVVASAVGGEGGGGGAE